MGNVVATDPDNFQFPNSACRIVVLSPTSGEDCVTELALLPRNARILAIGNTLEELMKDGNLFTEANVLLNLRGNAHNLQKIMQNLPYLEWVHSVTAGIDHIVCPELMSDGILLTNAKGIFSSSLAEYVMGAIAYFAKDFPRLMKQREERKWSQYCVTELRGKTMGIIGYGDIGQACAKLAKAYGMQVIGLRKNVQLSANDEFVDWVVGTDHLLQVISDSDYLVIACALTKETRGLMAKEQFAAAKPGQILINISRGPVINEDDLVEALTNGQLAGAALDVFCEEPLPAESKIWGLENVLLSPHNADMTADFRHKSVQFFCENCSRFIAGMPLKNLGFIDKETTQKEFLKKYTPFSPFFPHGDPTSAIAWSKPLIVARVATESNMDSSDQLRSLRNVREKWWKYNLNYEELRKHLCNVKKEYGLKRASSSRSLAGETRTFAEILDSDVEKMVLFYLRTQGDLANRLWQLREYQTANMQNSFRVTMDSINTMCQKYRDLGQDVLDLLEYLDSNVIALRRIIKKHDRLFDLHMGKVYFGSRMGPNSQLVQLYHQEGLYAIIGTIRRGFEDLYEMKHQLENDRFDDDDHRPAPRLGSMDRDDVSRSSSRRRLNSRRPSLDKGNIQRFASSTALHQLLKSKDNSFDATVQTGPTSLVRSLSSTLLSFLSAKGKKKSGIKLDAAAWTKLEPMLDKIEAASIKVLKSQKDSVDEYQAVHSSMGLTLTVRDMADSSDESDDGNAPEASTNGKRKRRKRSERITSKMGLFLTLFATFLYQMNQYVVAPTSGQYSDRLGMSPSLSGLIIGLSPFAALLSALVFSVWTNYSFKQPLIVCLVFLGTGNLLYALALQCNSSTLLFCGRLMTGLGVPRGITRRYIADHVSLADRTEASSQFVTAGAMGIALGPLLSSLVSCSGYSFTWVWGGTTIVQYELVTAPGWLMSIMFFTTLVVLIFTFQEPYIDQTPTPATSTTSTTANSLLKRKPSLMGRRPAGSSFLGATTRDLHGPDSSSQRASQRKTSSYFSFGPDDSGRSLSPANVEINSIRASTADRIRDVAQKVATAFGFGPQTNLNTSSSIMSIASGLSKASNSTGGQYGAISMQDVVQVELGDWTQRKDNHISLKSAAASSKKSTVNQSQDTQDDVIGRISVLTTATSVNDGNIQDEKKVITKTISLDELAAMARGESGPTIDGNAALLSDAAKELLIARSFSAEDESVNGGRDETASISASVKFGQTTAIMINKDVSESNVSDDISHHSGYTQYTLKSSRDPSAYDASGYDQMMTEFGGQSSKLQSYHDKENAYYESVYDNEDEDDVCSWFYGQCCPSWMCWCCDVLGNEVVVILFIYLINKIGQEMVVSSVPSLGTLLFGWDSQLAGFFMATMGFLVLPFNILVSKLAKETEDRMMMAYLNYLSFASVVFILPMPFLISYSTTQYVCGSIMIFVFLNALEGVIMSLLSKLVSPDLARGTWNSGLLATEAGTFGRVLGDIAITAFSATTPKNDLINVLYSPIAFGMVVVIVLCARHFDRMEV